MTIIQVLITWTNWYVLKTEQVLIITQLDVPPCPPAFFDVVAYDGGWNSQDAL